jgi:hypothetical protein
MSAIQAFRQLATLRPRTRLSVFVPRLREGDHPTVRRAAVEDALHALQGHPDASARDERRQMAALSAVVVGAMDDRDAGGHLLVASNGVIELDLALPLLDTMSVAWGDRVPILPALMAVRHQHSGVLVVATARTARVYSLRDGVLVRVSKRRAFGLSGPHVRLDGAPGFRPGGRGPTRTDAHQRMVRRERERMYSAVLRDVATVATRHTPVVVGGGPITTRVLLDRLMDEGYTRLVLAHDLGVADSPRRLSDVTTAELSAFADREHQLMVDRLLEESAARGNGCAGVIATLEAARHGAVHELYVTVENARRHPGGTEELAVAVLAAGGLVTLVEGPGAARLDALGEGVAARLRHALFRGPTLVEA